MNTQSTIYIHSDVIHVLSKDSGMRSFTDLFEACNWADSLGTWQYA